MAVRPRFGAMTNWRKPRTASCLITSGAGRASARPSYGGLEGVTIFNMQSVCGSTCIEYVADINSRKHDGFVAGTGQEVVPPEFYKKCRPNAVVEIKTVCECEIRRSTEVRHASR